MKAFPHYRQLDQMDCGPTCLLMVAKFYGKTFSLQSLRERSFITREGVSLLGISNAAEDIGLRSLGVVITYEQLKKERPLPCIVHWRQNHFIVVYEIKNRKVFIADPAVGLATLPESSFLEAWSTPPTDTSSSEPRKGIALLLEPTPTFYQREGDKKGVSLQFLWVYLRRYYALFGQLILGLLAGSVVQLIVPFLTQAVVDVGINQKNTSFLYLIFTAQLVLYICQTGISVLQSWVLLHISTRINISLISDFLLKLMSLPLAYFDGKTTGDLMQRIGDHQRIESFLTSTAISTLFSIVNLVIFSIVLVQYNLNIFGVYVLGSTLYLGWVWFFLKQRRELDYKNFAVSASNQSSLIQLITGMQEIKLHNAEKKMRWGWESIQAKLFRLSIRSLALNQIQSTGASGLNELKNLAISFMVAKAVVDGQMTLGMMLAVQYIIGSLNAPLAQFIGFIQGAQDASISVERLQEIHGREAEDELGMEALTLFPVDRCIKLRNVSFSYEGANGLSVLNDINLDIPEGKVTAIVGTSGSGKTTLLKLLLKFYPPTRGEILLGNTNLNLFQNSAWRDKCGAVLQDGYIFSDTIARNIAVADDRPDRTRLEQSVRMANIHEFIDSLPLGFNTKIGAEGTGLSQGQKQRLLIARAVYKNPEYLLFDEATNALDANNERKIVENLSEFFQHRTVVVIAHRLSTVQQADQIVVLSDGRIREQGTHSQLVAQKGAYYELVKNQLELGN